ncbi:Capsular polysaccharide biosynthesis protein [Sinosporangium album]|uniref:Capsular polysaccharide biosynthesis protein n=1 Tax=Sinosporangium album TaxID=504805 RepID=A0A1G8AJ69_9ACTN|nr:Wzz/FepE/Etk N-terminal domain-containing protein [Sinosporangium album]SDH20883.1 Capsular polysaccharide biosynthesis protein [Sinosporangium album]
MSLPQDTPARRSSDGFADLFGPLRRQWAIALLCLTAGFAGGLGVMRLAPQTFTATAHVLVSPTGAQEQVNQVTNRQREQLNLDTEAQVAVSAVVAKRAEQTLRAAGQAGEPPAIDVSVPPNSAVLAISADAVSPETAAAHANAYAKAYLAHRATSAKETLSAQLKALADKRRQISASLAKGAADLQTLPRGTAQHTLTAARQTMLNRQLATLALRYDALNTVAVTPGSVIGEAEPPSAPSSPNLPVSLGSGLMIGLLVGAGAALVRDRTDTRLRTAADVERLTSVPVLAVLPERGAWSDAVLRELAASMIAMCPSGQVLLQPVPAGGSTGPGRANPHAAVLAESLSLLAPVSVLGGGVGDLARADAALLVVTAGARAGDVAVATGRLARHGVTTVGAVLIPGGRGGQGGRGGRKPRGASEGAVKAAHAVHGRAGEGGRAGDAPGVRVT